MSNHSWTADIYLSEVLSVDPKIFKPEGGKTTCVFDPENWSYIIAISEELEMTKSAVINSLVSYARKKLAEKDVLIVQGEEGSWILPPVIAQAIRSGDANVEDFIDEQYFVSYEDQAYQQGIIN